MAFWTGLGLPLAIMALLAHGLDFMVKKPAIGYTQKVESFVKDMK